MVADERQERHRKIFTDAARPKLKIFLSADLVGSTAHKQSNNRANDFRSPDDWSRHIQRFYSEMAYEFDTSWGNWTHKVAEKQDSKTTITRSRNRFFGSAPRIWKTIGDEIVFWKEIESEDQVWFVLSAWLRAIAINRLWLLDKGLDIKSAAWTAGFPVLNRVIANGHYFLGFDEKEESQALELYDEGDRKFIRSEYRKKDGELKNLFLIDMYYKSAQESNDFNPGSFSQYVDFLGPGIDAGFRLANLSASSRRLAISPDLAYLMSISYREGKIKNCSNDLGDQDIVLIDDEDPVEVKPGHQKYKREAKIGRPSRVRDNQIDEHFKRHFSNLMLYYAGSESLKGVLGGAPYPLFWINSERKDSLDSLKSDLNREFMIGQGWDDIYLFCREFYKDRQDYAFPPFVYSGSQRPPEVSRTTYSEDEYENRLDSALVAMGL